ncbi:aldo-keto reductase superfamily protein [Rutstroemia sp. NJR-2017a BBW]|nr:aldo-keto reductase superfamily protein [Rutstroemia sp. NJR-2017a BBW]
MPNQMKYVNLGESGLRVSRICVGCMSFGDRTTRFKWCIEEEEALPVIEACWKAGMNFFDTANVYSNGVSEEILGKAIRKYNLPRENLVIATKVFAVLGKKTADGWENPFEMGRDEKDASGEEEKEMVPSLKKFGMGMIPWSPIAMGFLARPHAAFTESERGSGMNGKLMGYDIDEADIKINERIGEIAKERGVSMAVVAIAWSLSKDFMTSPIIGMSKVERVQEAVDAVNFELSKEEIESIDKLYRPKNTAGFS